MDLAIAVIIQDNASAGLKKISSTSDQAMNDVVQGAEKAGGAFERFGKKASELATKIDDQKSQLAILKDKYADLYLTMGAGAPETQKVAEQITELSGNLDTNQKALEEAQAAADSFDATMQDIPGTMDQAGQSSQQFGSVLDDLIPKFTKAQMIRKTVEALAEFGKEAIDTAATAETSFAKVSTLLSAGTDTTAFFDSIRNASRETGVSLSDFSEAVYQALSASVDQASAVQFTTEAIKLSKGGFTSAATAVDILTTAINAYGLKASDATSISNKLITTQNLGKTTVDELAQAMGRVIPTARSFNVDIDTLCGAYAVMTKNGIATAESTTYLNGMLNELGKSGTTASNVLKEKTGKSFSELMASGSSLGDVLTILQEEAARTGVSLGDMFGSQEAGKAANTLAANIDDLNSSIGAMANSTGAAETAYSTMMGTFNEQLNILKNNWDLVMESIGSKLLPIATKAISGINSLFNFASGNNQLKGTAASYEEATEKAAEYQRQIDAIYASYEAGEDISDSDFMQINSLTAAMNNYLQQAEDFKAGNAQLAESAAEPATSFQEATEQYTTAATALLEQYQATYEATLSNVEGWFGPFDQAGTKVSTTLQQITDNMQSQIDFNNQYADNLQYLADNGLGSLGDALQSYGADGSAYAAAIVEQLQAVGGATSEEGQAIIENLTGLMDGMAESQSAVAENFTDMGGQFSEQMQTISEQYAETIQGLDKSGEAMEAATSTISSFISGLDSSKGGIMDTMGSIGAQMTNALQAALGDVHINVTASMTMSGGGRAIGLDYVPYNGMPAILHRGEAILNAPEAEDWRRGRSRGNSQGITIIQNIQSVPQTPVQLAAATQAMFEQARWSL